MPASADLKRLEEKARARFMTPVATPFTPCSSNDACKLLLVAPLVASIISAICDPLSASFATCFTGMRAPALLRVFIAPLPRAFVAPLPRAVVAPLLRAVVAKALPAALLTPLPAVFAAMVPVALPSPCCASLEAVRAAAPASPDSSL
jgi:hypothetical protein